MTFGEALDWIENRGGRIINRAWPVEDFIMISVNGILPELTYIKNGKQVKFELDQATIYIDEGYGVLHKLSNFPIFTHANLEQCAEKPNHKDELSWLIRYRLSKKSA